MPAPLTLGRRLVTAVEGIVPTLQNVVTAVNQGFLSAVFGLSGLGSTIPVYPSLRARFLELFPGAWLACQKVGWDFISITHAAFVDTTF